VGERWGGGGGRGGEVIMRENNIYRVSVYEFFGMVVLLIGPKKYGFFFNAS